MIIKTIKLDATLLEEFNDAEADELIEAIDSVDWKDLARQAIQGALRAESSKIAAGRVKITEDTDQGWAF